jgi:hypothetical protein
MAAEAVSRASRPVGGPALRRAGPQVTCPAPEPPATPRCSKSRCHRRRAPAAGRRDPFAGGLDRQRAWRGRGISLIWQAGPWRSIRTPARGGQHMGVMLSLDRRGPSRDRRRAQHARRPDGPAREVLAVVRRCDAPGRGRLLKRLTRIVLARRAPARRTGAEPARGVPIERAWSLYPGLSVACLLGECRDEAGRPVCEAGRCEHDCHRDATAPGPDPGAAPAA